MAFSFRRLIERKRDGGMLRAEEIRWIIAELYDGHLPDYQMAAMLMAVFIAGSTVLNWRLDRRHAPLRGGARILRHRRPQTRQALNGRRRRQGIIPLAPMVAACGAAVPMMSGRGLGHTGGTVDKLETIPGFTTQLTPEEFVSVVEKTGLVLAGQSETLAPADRGLYALRDATGIGALDPTHRFLDHVQEAGRRSRLPGA